MRHRGRPADQRLDAAKADREGEELQPVHKPLQIIFLFIQAEGNHSASSLCLLFLDGVSPVPGQSRIEHLAGRLALFQELGDQAGVVQVPVEPDAQGLDPPLQQEGIRRRQDAAQRVVDEFQSREELFIIQDDQPREDIGMARIVFGGRVHGDVGAKVQRPLQIRRHEGVVHHHENISPVRRFGNSPDIGHFQKRIGRRLQKYHLYAVVGLVKIVRVEVVHDLVGSPSLLQQVGDKSPGPAVHVVVDQKLIPFFQKLKDKAGRRHTRGRRDPEPGTLDIRCKLFHGSSRGIIGSAVTVLPLRFHIRLNERSGQVDRIIHCLFFSVGEPAVDGGRIEPHQQSSPFVPGIGSILSSV